MSQDSNSTAGIIGKLRGFYVKHYVLSNVAMMLVVLAFMGFFTFFFLDVWTNHGRTTEVPDIRNCSFDEAIQRLDDVDLEYEISDSIYDTKLAPGTVKEVWPHPGSHVKPGRVVYLIINSFQPQRVTISMPLTGVSSRQAVSYLESLNVRNIRIVYVPSKFPDLVEGARYKGHNLKSGMQIPVNAEVVLEVGVLREGPRENNSADEYIDDFVSGEDNDVDTGASEPAAEDDPDYAKDDVFN